MRILLINPPIYDFSAFDFWMRPLGLLRAGGYLRGRAELVLWDFLDPGHAKPDSADRWGRRKPVSTIVDKPPCLSDIGRRYRRYGRPRDSFEAFLLSQPPFDAALIQTTMTYWYPGAREVLDTLGRLSPGIRTVMGGVYCTLCPDHARALGADLVVEGRRLDPLWDLLGIRPDRTQPPYWEGYRRNDVGVLKLTDGCPFRCTYCSVPVTQPRFRIRPRDEPVRETLWLLKQGVRHVAFYDDALLFRPRDALEPYLEWVLQSRLSLRFHTPNALNARFLSKELAALMVRAGVRQIFIGFESSASSWQKTTGGKVSNEELDRAAGALREAGVRPSEATAYLIVGHPCADLQEIEASMRLAHRLGLRLMLSEFSPLPGTPDGEACRRWTDLDEPLNHNKIAFTHRFLGGERLQQLKDLSRWLNQSL